MLPARERKKHLWTRLEADERQRWRMHRQIAGTSFLLKRLTWPLWCRLCWPACPPYSPSLRRRPDWSPRTPPGGRGKVMFGNGMLEFKNQCINEQKLFLEYTNKEKDLWQARCRFFVFLTSFLFLLHSRVNEPSDIKEANWVIHSLQDSEGIVKGCSLDT